MLLLLLVLLLLLLLLLLGLLGLLDVGRPPNSLSPALPYTAKRRVTISRTPAIVENWSCVTVAVAGNGTT